MLHNLIILSLTQSALLNSWLLIETCQCIQQTQSAMADHDPEISLSLTPAKRVSVHQGLEELSSPTMETTQQSSTKAMKNIKIKKT